MKSKQEILNQLKLYEADVKRYAECADEAESVDDSVANVYWQKMEFGARGRVSALRWVLDGEEKEK